MELGSIEREIYIEASPEVVFEVISTPEHLRQWWPDDVDIDPVPGATGRLVFGDPADPNAKVAPMTVVEVDPPLAPPARIGSARRCTIAAHHCPHHLGRRGRAGADRRRDAWLLPDCR